MKCYPICTQAATRDADKGNRAGIGIGQDGDPTSSLRTNQPPAVGIDEPQYVVRRITPVEAERLQGFPDGWTDIEYNGKPAPDTLRYKALGNSMTVNVMRWLAERILEADKDGI